MNYYEKAWVITSFTSPGLGFRLATSYLKTKNFVKCIDVCETVLKLHPDYPKLDKEIL